jgi:ribosomal protein S21
LEIRVNGYNLEKALNLLKRKLQKDGLTQELKKGVSMRNPPSR